MHSASFSPSDSFEMYKQLWATVTLQCYEARVSWPYANVPSVLHLTSVQSHILSGLDWPPFFPLPLCNQLHFPLWLRTDSICLKVTMCISVKKSLSFHSNSISKGHRLLQPLAQCSGFAPMKSPAKMSIKDVHLCPVFNGAWLITRTRPSLTLWHWYIYTFIWHASILVY